MICFRKSIKILKSVLRVLLTSYLNAQAVIILDFHVFERIVRVTGLKV